MTTAAVMQIPRGRAVGIDLGDRRIGVAASDRDRTLAHPEQVVVRSGDLARDHEAIAGIVAELDAVVVVVGLPLSLSGRGGPAARKIADETESLRSRLAVPVVAQDERLSTVEATRRRAEARPRRARQPTAKRRPVVDDLAAAVLLQAWIDGGERS